MATHGQTISWGSHAGRKVQSVGWLQRLRQWFADRAAGNGKPTSIAMYGSWDSKREKFRSPTAESALDHVAAQGGRSWSITMYNAGL
jgi:hypothetical protein